MGHHLTSFTNIKPIADSGFGRLLSRCHPGPWSSYWVAEYPSLRTVYKQGTQYHLPNLHLWSSPAYSQLLVQVDSWGAVPTTCWLVIITAYLIKRNNWMGIYIYIYINPRPTLVGTLTIIPAFWRVEALEPEIFSIKKPEMWTPWPSSRLIDWAWVDGLLLLFLFHKACSFWRLPFGQTHRFVPGPSQEARSKGELALEALPRSSLATGSKALVNNALLRQWTLRADWPSVHIWGLPKERGYS